MIRSRARTPAREPRGIEKFSLWTALGLPVDVTTRVVIVGEALDKELLDNEEVLDEDVAEDEVGLISVYLHPRSMEEIGITNEKAQTLDRLRSRMVPPVERILRVCVVHSPTPWTTRRHWTPHSLRLPLYLADCDQQGRQK